VIESLSVMVDAIVERNDGHQDPSFEFNIDITPIIKSTNGKEQHWQKSNM
jgi:hypothetical protein